MYTETITNLQAAVDATPGICELLFLPTQSIIKMPDFRVAQSAYQDTPDNIWSLQNSYFDLKENWKNFNTGALSIKFKENHETTAYRDWETDRKSTRLNSSHSAKSRMPSSA